MSDELLVAFQWRAGMTLGEFWSCGYVLAIADDESGGVDGDDDD